MNATETISPELALQALEGLVSDYTLESIRSQLFQREHEAEKAAFDERHGWSYWSQSGKTTHLNASKSFNDRAEAMAWLRDLGLTNPEFSKMSYATSTGEPKTLCTLKCTGEFENVPFQIEANYVRNGLPTKNCRVEPSISYSVVCDLKK